MVRSLGRCLFGSPHHQNRLSPVTPSAEDAWAALLLVNDWIKHAEAKLGVVLALVGVLAAGLIALVTVVEIPSGLLLTFALIAALLITASAVCATIGLLPKFRAQKDGSDLNPLFYADVAKHFAEREPVYVQNFKALLADHDALVFQLARQVWANSAVAARKYRWANRATLIGAAALLAALATGVVAIRWS